MNESELRDLERRLSASLHAAAPHPAPDLADRLLRQTLAQPQRRGILAISFSSALAVAAVVVIAVAIGLGIGTLVPRGGFVGGPSESPAASSTPPASTSGEPTAVPTPSDSAAPSPSGPFPEGSNRCTNDEIGYSVGYPADWWANERIEPEPPLTPIPACVAFAPEPVELRPNSELPPEVAISAGLREPPAGPDTQPIEVLESRETEVAGRPATIEEIRWTEDTVFQRAGDRAYAYRIELANGQILGFGAQTTAVIGDEQYEEAKAVLDAMMESLQLSGG